MAERRRSGLGDEARGLYLKVRGGDASADTSTRRLPDASERFRCSDSLADPSLEMVVPVCG